MGQATTRGEEVRDRRGTGARRRAGRTWPSRTGGHRRPCRWPDRPRAALRAGPGGDLLRLVLRRRHELRCEHHQRVRQGTGYRTARRRRGHPPGRHGQPHRRAGQPPSPCGAGQAARGRGGGQPPDRHHDPGPHPAGRQQRGGDLLPPGRLGGTRRRLRQQPAQQRLPARLPGHQQHAPGGGRSREGDRDPGRAGGTAQPDRHDRAARGQAGDDRPLRRGQPGQLLRGHEGARRCPGVPEESRPGDEIRHRPARRGADAEGRGRTVVRPSADRAPPRRPRPDRPAAGVPVRGRPEGDLQ